MKKKFCLLMLVLFNNVYSQQSSSQILMVRPANFGFNAQTASSNAFQNLPTESDSLIQKKALQEFDNAVDILKQKGVNIFIVEDTKSPIKPDAIFPNNWISFNPDGKIFIYPMHSPNRRLEKRTDILKDFYQTYHIKELTDWTEYETQSKYLEGTGSIVFDHINKIIFACLSPRTHQDLITLLANKLKYKAVVFNANDEKQKPIYHTNVMMSIGTKFAVICSQSITNLKEKQNVLNNLKKNNKTIIDISLSQMNNFVGNLLEVKNKQGKTIIVLSLRALKNLTHKQIRALSQFGELVSIDIPTIENIGGGSARCMIAQVLLSPK